MRKIDLINSGDEGKVALALSELDKCWTQGECVRCGMCCITYATNIPERKPQDAADEVRTEVKDTMEPCKHLVEDDKGRFGCACHDVKDNPALAVCNNWRGDFRGEFRAMMLMYANNLVFMATQEEIMMADTLCRRGSIAELPIDTFTSEKVRDFLFQTFLCKNPPYALWDAMDLEFYFLKMRRAEFEKLYMDREEIFYLDEGNSVHVEFAKRYLHFDPFKRESAGFDFPQSFLPANEN